MQGNSPADEDLGRAFQGAWRVFVGDGLGCAAMCRYGPVADPVTKHLQTAEVYDPRSLPGRRRAHNN
jgi:hypothetical protein